MASSILSRLGSSFGNAIVRPENALIAFTGSKAVGLGFMNAQPSQPGQIWIKRTILEMGGKIYPCLRRCRSRRRN